VKGLAERAVLTAQRIALRIAPPGFRARFGEELLACARESMREAQTRHGSPASLARGMRQTIDIGLNALRLRCQQPSMKKSLLLLPLVLLLAVGTAWMDSYQDEVQPAVLLLFVGAATFAFLDPARAWLWWLVLGCSIPGARLWMNLHGTGTDQGPFLATFLALLPAGFGALTGFGLRKYWPRRPRPGAVA
jgi:hypothetical protein